MKRKIVLRGGVMLLVILACYILFTAFSIVSYSYVDETCRADAALVLGAGSAGGRISPVFQARMDHGIWLYQNGYVDLLILTGGVGEGETTSDAYAARSYALEQGVPDAVILMEETSTITQENIENASQIAGQAQVQSVLVVSDPLHMKRAMLMARDVGMEAYSSPTRTTRYQTWRTKLPFLIREEFFYVGYRIVRLF